MKEIALAGIWMAVLIIMIFVIQIYNKLILILELLN